MATSKKSIILGLCACLSMPFFFGCEEKGPAEKAGEKIDKAFKDAGDAMEDAGDKIKEKMD